MIVGSKQEKAPEEITGGNIYGDEIMGKLTEGFKNHGISDPKINLKVANAVNEVWDKKLTSDQ